MDAEKLQYYWGGTWETSCGSPRYMDMDAVEQGPSDERQRDGRRESLEAPARDEEDIVPPTELAFPQVEEGRLEEEKERRQRDEELFRRAEEQGAGPSEVAVPPPVERHPSRWEPPVTLESAESRISGRPPSLRSVVPPEPTISEFATKLYTVSYLIFFSIFGALARVGMETLTYYPGAPVTTGVLWANVGGCLLMGFFAEDRNLFREEWGERQTAEKDDDMATCSPPRLDRRATIREDDLKIHKAIKKTIPLYVGLTTGFCGSFTSFSSFMGDVFLALSNDLPNPNSGSILPRNGGYSFMAVVAVILYTLSLSLSSLAFGAHLAVALDRYTPTLPFLVTRRIVDRSIVVLAFGCWLGSVLLAIWPPDRHNGARENWRGRLTGCQVLNGIMDGFCGCTTTDKIRNYYLGSGYHQQFLHRTPVPGVYHSRSDHEVLL
ncbi:hypothetical protein UREG_04803 [Uncinocarpus reesii 1704]|uniref:Fluoride ion transporter CrcB n=1 Tax=Uncinocarpus reesii (strain UAMH 1704) TaxID=336963 RepID=C4JUK0_UNCRE|nr:uncharacterized protein UREG_04803 [Uncinocarpus reesii 1704]EEP79961.1 hypothetical protein UREG_04803 [Uncinocarpus reesii 1704]